MLNKWLIEVGINSPPCSNSKPSAKTNLKKVFFFKIAHDLQGNCLQPKLGICFSEPFI